MIYSVTHLLMDIEISGSQTSLYNGVTWELQNIVMHSYGSPRIPPRDCDLLDVGCSLNFGIFKRPSGDSNMQTSSATSELGCSQFFHDHQQTAITILCVSRCAHDQQFL